MGGRVIRFLEVKIALGLPESFDFLERAWQQAEEADFLTNESVASACEFMHMAPEVRQACLGVLPRVRNNAALYSLAWQIHCLMFHEQAREIQWPMLPAMLGDAADMFYAVIFASGVDHVRELHASKGIPEEITVATLADLELWMREYHRLYGRWGLWDMGWLINHFSGQLFALGRLQFQFSRFPFDFHAWRNVESGQVVLLAGTGMRLRRDGQFDGANGICDESGAWVASYDDGGDEVRGFPISPDGGSAVNEVVSLLKSEWRLVLEKDSPVLAVHIPATGPMDHAACRDSYRQALEFFPRYFPEFRFAAFDCDSWLLDAQLRDYLPAESNIVRFLNDFHLYPLAGASDAQTIERVFGFGIKAVDLESAPQDTSLRRAIVSHMKNGGHWRQGGGIIWSAPAKRSDVPSRRRSALTEWKAGIEPSQSAVVASLCRRTPNGQ